MQRMRAVLGGLLLFIWIMAAAGCTDQKPEQTVKITVLLGDCDLGRRKR